MPRRLEADDEVWRFQSVWLGPDEYTLPWHARYVSYVLFFAVFGAVLLFEGVTPFSVGLPPVWEFVIAVMTTSALMAAVDYDKPLMAVVRNAYNIARLPATTDPAPMTVRPYLGTIVKVTREPL